MYRQSRHVSRAKQKAFFCQLYVGNNIRNLKCFNALIIIDTLKTRLQIKTEDYLNILNIYGCIPTLNEVDSVQIIKNSCTSILKKFSNYV